MKAFHYFMDQITSLTNPYIPHKIKTFYVQLQSKRCSLVLPRYTISIPIENWSHINILLHHWIAMQYIFYWRPAPLSNFFTWDPTSFEQTDQTDRHDWKHYLPANYACGSNNNEIKINIIGGSIGWRATRDAFPPAGPISLHFHEVFGTNLAK